MSLFELKSKISTLDHEIALDANYINEKTADPTVQLDDIKAKEAHRDELVYRRDLLRKQHDLEETSQRRALEIQEARANVTPEMSGSDKAKGARGKLYRAIINREDLSKVFSDPSLKAYTGLGAIPTGSADYGSGDSLLPINVSKEIIVEPGEMNPIRGVATVSNITGLIEPALDFSYSGDFDDLNDFADGALVEANASDITYERHSIRPYVPVSDSLLDCTDADLAGVIENGLQKGLALNEMARIFSAVPASTYEKMSLYSTYNNVSTVTASTLKAAIAAASAALPMGYINRTLVINPADWYQVWASEPNGAGRSPDAWTQDFFGLKVVLCSAAQSGKPIVGDFSYLRINYERGARFELDRTAKQGKNDFVLSATYDIRVRKANAFRIAAVTPEG
jgi:HK97 family phage major capsid protein